MRRLASTLLVGATALATVGCSEIASPRRAASYEYRVFVSNQAGGTDTLAFHWPRSTMPVRIWVATDDPLREGVLAAIERWESAFLYGEWRADLVSDSARADIIVRNVIAPAGPNLSRLESLAPQCLGATDIDASRAQRRLTLPIRVYVWPRFAANDPEMPTCYRLTVTHEIGHAIGIFAHSPNSGDVMFANPVLDGISERDRLTAETAYHLAPTLEPFGRR
jgi:hypothetical protein